VAGTDQIDLTGIDADTTHAGQDAFSFMGSAAFGGQAGELHAVYDSVRNVTVLEGDTNGDRVADFGIELTGQITLTTVDIVSGAALPHEGAGFTAPAGWTVKGTADFNNDGQIDIVASNGGVNRLWLLNNNAVSQTIGLPSDADGWTLRGIADVNGDGQKDLISTNPRYNTPWVYYFNGSTQTGSTWAPSSVTPDAVQTLLEDEGGDTVISAVNYTPPTGVENLTLTMAVGDTTSGGNNAGNIVIGNFDKYINDLDENDRPIVDANNTPIDTAAGDQAQMASLELTLPGQSDFNDMPSVDTITIALLPIAPNAADPILEDSISVTTPSTGDAVDVSAGWDSASPSQQGAADVMTRDRAAAVPVRQGKMAHTMAHDFEQTSLPPSDVIRAIKAGSIELRVGSADEAAIETPLWFLDEASGSLQQFGSSDQPDTVRLAINDEPESEGPDAAHTVGQTGTAMLVKPSFVANHSPAWMQALRDWTTGWL
jgi:hypothetical protein